MAEFKPSRVTGDVEVIGRPITIRPFASFAAVSVSTLTTIFTFTALVNTLVKKISVSGELPCRVDFVKNTATQEVKRLTSNRNVLFDFAAPFPLGIGDIVEIKVFHGFTGETSRYDTTLYGFPE